MKIRSPVKLRTYLMINPSYKKERQSKMKKINIYVGNVNCTAGSGYGNTELMPLVEDIFPKNTNIPDIVILNEFYKYKDYQDFQAYFLNKEYTVEVNPLKKKGFNDVFVAISSRLDLDIETVEYATQDKDRISPDYTSVILRNKKNEKLAIVGVRIRSYKNLDYKGNASEFIALLSFIEKLRKSGITQIMVAGDFNHARLLTDRNEELTWEEIEILYKEHAQLPHNFHGIKQNLSQNNLILHTPEGYSYPINKSYPVHNQETPNDHLVTSNDCEIDFIEYRDETKYSDHKALVATLHFNRKD